MFSCVDAGGSRVLEVHASVEGLWYRAQLPPELSSLHRLAKRLPSERVLSQLLSELRGRVWVLNAARDVTDSLPRGASGAVWPSFGSADLVGAASLPHLSVWGGSPAEARARCHIESWRIKVLRVEFHPDDREVVVAPITTLQQP